MEPNLVVYKPFGVPTENDMFDDVKTYSLWPVNTSLPKLIQLAIFTDDAPGANGINGIETAYEVNLGGKPVFTKHGELSGKRHVIDAGECNIVKITATVDKDPAKPVLRALAFELADGSKLGPFPGVSLPPDHLMEVSAPGLTVGFYGSINEKDSRICSLGVYARELIRN